MEQKDTGVSPARSKALVKRNAPRIPASGRPGSNDLPFNAFLVWLDPCGNSERSHAVRLALAISPDSRFREFLARLDSPRYQRQSLATIAAAGCGLTFGEFRAFWHNAQLERAIDFATCAAPAVMEAQASAARGTEVECGRCDGLGWVAAPEGVPPEFVRGYLGCLPGHSEARRSCPRCKGSGRFRQPADPHAVDRILEIAGLIGKNRPAVQIVQNFSGASHASAVPELSSMTIDVSAEVVDKS